MHDSAAQRLDYGDDVNRRLAQGVQQAAIAVTDGLSPQAVSKAAWLARTYDAEARHLLGSAVLEGLTPSHFEVVAALDPEARIALLRRATADRFSVRRLKEIARRSNPSDIATRTQKVRVLGKPGDLACVSAAAQGYASWDDRALRALLGGPNGLTIRDLASAGRALAERIEEVSPVDPPPSSK